MYMLVTVYHLPKPIYDTQDLTARLTDDIDILTSIYPQAILLVCGDFNQLDLSLLLADTAFVTSTLVLPVEGIH